ncbi:hypothetical protein [Methanogenium cariaci]|uniref:hypothetical protein n=1 Tax=Methanogenium cariaci TaxID=2197 RepID=UPI0012F62793|nr:hypothetical protein [Methanogenium cariaci]
MSSAVQTSFEMFGYPAHPPGIGKIALQLLQHMDEIKAGGSETRSLLMSGPRTSCSTIVTRRSDT